MYRKESNQSGRALNRIFLPEFLVLSVLIFFSRNCLGAEVSFRISIPQPQTHIIQVEMTLDGARGDEIIGMPVWTPGSYLVREFQRHVQDISASGHNGQPLSIKKIDKNHWQIDGAMRDKKMVIRYQVYAFEHSVRTSFVNAEHALINGASVFMYWKNHLSAKQTVDLELPESWSTISTSLEPYDNRKATRFFAKDYDELVDSPFEIGNHHEIRFEVAGKPHLIAIYGTSNYNDSTLIEDFTKIILAEKAIWGELPYNRYVFIFNLGDGGGGLEHKQSSVMFARRWTFTDKHAYHSFLSLVAHEFFHTWNIKRLRPEGLGPFDYDQEAYTENLWFVEGLTSYYDELLMLRSGFYQPDDYLLSITNEINRLESKAGKLHQSLSEASWDAWIKFYRPDEHTDNSTISYYNKGALVGMLLNLKILDASNGEKCLEDVLRLLYQQNYYDKDKPFAEKDILSATEHISGVPMDEFFSQYIHGTAELPYAETLHLAGLKLDTTKAGDAAYMGIEINESNGRFLIRRVVENSPAWTAGINVHDELIALDGFRVTQFPPIYLKERRAGDRIIATVSRTGILQDISLTLGSPPESILGLSRVENPSDDQKLIYQTWLGTAWPDTLNR